MKLLSLKRSVLVLALSIASSALAAEEFPLPDGLVMVEPGMEGIPEAKAAAEFWSNEWSDPTFMAIGELHANLGLKTMLPLSRTIRGCPEPMRIKDAGHFVQERGEPIARAALHAFGDA